MDELTDMQKLYETLLKKALEDGVITKDEQAILDQVICFAKSPAATTSKIATPTTAKRREISNGAEGRLSSAAARTSGRVWAWSEAIPKPQFPLRTALLPPGGVDQTRNIH